jgi:hypothetical protein
MEQERSGPLDVVLSYVEAAQQARRSQRDDDWQRVAELLAIRRHRQHHSEDYCERESTIICCSSGGLRDVHHEVRRRLRARRGSGYLPSSTTTCRPHAGTAAPHTVMTILPLLPWPSTRYRMASGTSRSG